MKKFLMFAIILALVSGGTWYYLKGGKKEVKKNYAKAEAAAERISEYIETTGQVEPKNRVEILPPSGGRIEKIFAEEAQEIKNGDILALMSSQDRVAILDAARAQGEKEYDYWQDSYKPIKIVSPLSGRIILRNVVEGQTVSAGTVLFAMSDMLIVVANVDEADIGKVKIGQSAVITLDAYPTQPVNGRVFQILDEGKNSSNVIIYKVKIKLDSIPDFFKSQMTANIKIEITRGKKVLMVPSAALNYSKDGKTYVITGFDKKKTPLEQPVETGNENDGKTEIKSGLEEGDAVYFESKGYRAQSVGETGSSPLMPKRPGQRNKNVQRAMRNTR